MTLIMVAFWAAAIWAIAYVVRWIRRPGRCLP
jgi:hypothetical protein